MCEHHVKNGGSVTLRLNRFGDFHYISPHVLEFEKKIIACPLCRQENESRYHAGEGYPFYIDLPSYVKKK